jgi:hypothetical protein
MKQLLDFILHLGQEDVEDKIIQERGKIRCTGGARAYKFFVKT